MITVKSVILLSLALSLFLLLPIQVLGHPGNTASDGCHYCRTNCSKWGEVEGARHCHGGYTEPDPVYIAPVSTSKSITPSPATPRPTVEPTIEPTPEVLGAVTADSTITPVFTPTAVPLVQSDKSSNDNLMGLGAVGVVAYLAWRAKKSQNITSNLIS